MGNGARFYLKLVSTFKKLNDEKVAEKQLSIIIRKYANFRIE